MKKLNLTFALTLTTALFLSCNKELFVPEPKLEKIFGAWEWIESSSSEGKITTPDTEGYTITLEYLRNGKYKKYQNGKKIHRRNFFFIEGNTLASPDIETYLIDYTKGTIKEQQYVANSFQFISSDTLVLTIECFDCHSHTYVRK